MKTPSAHHEPELRERILLAASELFWKEGYGSASMRKIAEQAGCSAGNLYWYFENKDELLDEICAETFARLTQQMESAKHATLPPLEALVRGIRIYIDFGVANPAHYAATFLVDRKPPVLAEGEVCRREVIGRSCFQGLVEAVGRAAAAGLLIDKPIEEMAQAIWAASHGAVALLITMPSSWLLRDRLTENVAQMTIHGLAKPKS